MSLRASAWRGEVGRGLLEEQLGLPGLALASAQRALEEQGRGRAVGVLRLVVGAP